MINGNQVFVDYYGVLQVDPRCDAKILEAAYHHLAKMYHPDRTGTADTTKFSQIIEAYRVLRSPEQRAQYDKLHFADARQGPGIPWRTGPQVDDKSALDDAEAHAKILMRLYDKRRENAQEAGVVAFYLQEMLKCSYEHFEFHKWYLKEKGFITVTEQGTLAITIQGVDHVISMSRTTTAEKLRIAQSVNSQDQAL